MLITTLWNLKSVTFFDGISQGYREKRKFVSNYHAGRKTSERLGHLPRHDAIEHNSLDKIT